MMLTITRPLEQALMEVPGVRRVRSRTFRGATEISAQFEPDTDMVVALQQAQGRLAEVRPDLPESLDLLVDRLTPTAFPFYILDITGGLPSADLHDYGYYVVRPALARVAGVGRVEVLASDTREIEVITDPNKLLAAGLTVDDVAGALRQREHRRAGRPIHAERPAVSGAGVRPLEFGRSRSAPRPSSSGTAPRYASPTWRPSPPARPTARCWCSATARIPPPSPWRSKSARTS